MKILSRGLLAAACAFVLLVAPASADRSATIRVEGQNATLLPKTPVSVPDAGDIPGADADCEWNEPAGALEKGTGGNWDRQSFVQTILGERQSGSRGWFYFMNGKYGGGFCFEEMPPGADIVVYAAEYDQEFNPKELPPFLRDVPARVDRGVPFTVSVVEPVPDRHPQDGYYLSGTGTFRPASGVTVTAADATATTNAEGKATLTVLRTGETLIQARRGTSAARSEAQSLCVSNGQDGTCGTAAPPTPAQAPPVAPCETSGSDGLCGTRDREAPKTLIDSIREQQAFRAGRVPRIVRGRAGITQRRDFRRAGLLAEPSGVATVELRLTRTHRGACSALDARRERFVKRRCGARHGTYFDVAERSEWEYQLPLTLPRGRYVLDVRAADGAGNKDYERRRGENRVVFFVR